MLNKIKGEEMKKEEEDITINTNREVTQPPCKLINQRYT